MVPSAAQPNPAHAPQYIGPYAIETLLGAGGQSQVFAGRSADQSSAVAIKWSRHRFDPPSSDPLTNEFRLLSSLRHPQLTQAYDFGYADGRAYLVVDKVDGPALFAGIRETGIAGFWTLIRAVAPVLGFLHAGASSTAI